MTHEEKEEIKRLFDVVAESLRSEIRALAEVVARSNARAAGLTRSEGQVDRPDDVSGTS